MILYGISTCDSCKRALKDIRDAGGEVTFRDIRQEALSAAEIAEITAAFGDRAVNKQSTSYRAFSDFLKASDAEEQIAAQPTVMKRPVIRLGQDWFLGWDDQTRSQVLQTI